MMYGNCTSKKELLQFIDQVSFAIDDLLLFLDTHPKEKRALEYYSELSARRNELLEKYAKFYGPLTIDTGNDSNLKSWQWMEQPFPWEQEGGCTVYIQPVWWAGRRNRSFHAVSFPAFYRTEPDGRGSAQ